MLFAPSFIMSSFAVPRNVPSFNDPQRRYEDALWGSSQTSRYTTGASNGFGLHMPGSGGSKELPMYKDKPYNYPSSRRRGRKRIYLTLSLFLGVFWLYYKGWFAGEASEYAATGDVVDAKSLWGTLSSGSKGPVNWSQRREQVKKAMEISWAGYEKYAWGMFI